MKVQTMMNLVWRKFTSNPTLAKKLLDTGDAYLIEGNWWGDTFWGICKDKGENHLGKILMQIRAHIMTDGFKPWNERRPVRPTPQDKTYEPKPGTVFVFGSNIDGVHGAGAARYAYKFCGAVWEQGEGLMGDASTGYCSYALPTKRNTAFSLPLQEVKRHVDRFIEFAWEHRELKFFVTRIGCGLAGFTDDMIGPLFKDAPPNCELPHDWEQYAEDEVSVL
jgi:hypothetical protein